MILWTFVAPICITKSQKRRIHRTKHQDPQVWQRATKKLARRRPVTRDDASRAERDSVLSLRQFLRLLPLSLSLSLRQSVLRRAVKTAANQRRRTQRCAMRCLPFLTAILPSFLSSHQEGSLAAHSGEHHFLFNSVPVVVVCLRSHWAGWTELNRK